MFRLARMLLFPALFLPSTAAVAQEDEVPYWASINASEVNMRVGPATTYRIEWVYKREQLPLKVVRRMEGWRLVEDPDGVRGWVVGRFLSRERSAIVIGEGYAPMRDGKKVDGATSWRLEPGVVGRLGDCDEGWCSFKVGRYEGRVPQDRLWGAGQP